MSTGGSALVVAKRIAMSGDAARRSACATSRPGLATGRLFGEILGDEEACFAAAHDVKVAVAIEILHGTMWRIHSMAPFPPLRYSYQYRPSGSRSPGSLPLCAM